MEETKESFVYLLNADELRYSERINPDAQILVGNVVFRQDSMYMYCDSALFFQEANSFNAYHNIRVEQGDTLFLYGDSLFYDGNTRILKIRDNVRIENTTMVLLTDSLNYERDAELGYFFAGGTLLDEDNTLTADYGQFHTPTKMATFMKDVFLESVDYSLSSDTLLYNTDLHTAYFVSPTEIISDETTIHTSKGNFNTDVKEATLLNRSVIIQKDGEQTMVGDSIVFNESKGQAEAFGGVQIRNYPDKIDMDGEYAYFSQENDSAVVTGKALAVEYSAGDSLYIHADTFRLLTFYNATRDTVLYREMRAFNKVKAYRTDIQMVADSLVFNSLDTCLTLYKDPIVWSENQQVLGEKISVYMNDSTIEWAHVIGQALFAQQIDTVHYNQIAGREMKAYFKDGAIERTDVNGNVLVIYYPEDEDMQMMGMNTTEASQLSAYFMNREVYQIVIQKKSNGVMYPMDQLTDKIMYLESFNWFNNLRPFSRYDIFNWRGKSASEQLKSSPAIDIPLPTLNRNRN
ncbi:MAG: hypothetical protein J6Q08_04075 [Bacteroidaceae bacterium]|nr:hypothetical protein [Bacteroidaceae bacterium]